MQKPHTRGHGEAVGSVTPATSTANGTEKPTAARLREPIQRLKHRTKRRAVDILAYFDRPRTGNGPGRYTQRKVAASDVQRNVGLHSDPEILGGTPVFVGTRVPVKSLYDFLEAGDSLDEFLESFPSVTRQQAIAALELARTMTRRLRLLLDEWVSGRCWEILPPTPPAGPLYSHRISRCLLPFLSF